MTHNRTNAPGDRRCIGHGAGQPWRGALPLGNSSQWLITIAKTPALAPWAAGECPASTKEEWTVEPTTKSFLRNFVLKSRYCFLRALIVAVPVALDPMYLP